MFCKRFVASRWAGYEQRNPPVLRLTRMTWPTIAGEILEDEVDAAPQCPPFPGFARSRVIGTSKIFGHTDWKNALWRWTDNRDLLHTSPQTLPIKV